MEQRPFKSPPADQDLRPHVQLREWLLQGRATAMRRILSVVANDSPPLTLGAFRSLSLVPIAISIADLIPPDGRPSRFRWTEGVRELLVPLVGFGIVLGALLGTRILAW